LFGIVAMTLLYPQVWVSFVEQITAMLRWKELRF
jgi:hypothetical protein